MTLSKRVLTGLAATATTGALVLATPGMANAANYDKGNSDRNRVAIDADGDAQARAKANDDGRLRISGEAEGGAGATPLGADEDTIARSVASLKRSVPVADGTYRVVVRYKGAKGSDRDRQGGDARAKLTSTVNYDGETLRRNRDLKPEARRQVAKFVIDIPEGSSGQLTVKGALKGKAVAPTAGDFGAYSGRVRDVSFTVKRIGD